MLKEIRPWIPKQRMSVLFSILELNEIAFTFLTIASVIIFFQFGSYIFFLSLEPHSRIQIVFLDLLSCYGLVLATEKKCNKMWDMVIGPL